MDRAGDRPLLAHRSVAAAVAVALMSAAAACGGGGGRAPGSDGESASVDRPTGGNPAGVRAEERCDLGFNTARFNETTELVHHAHGHHEAGPVDFTLEEWAEVFVDEDLGLDPDEVLAELDEDEIYRRHVLGGVLAHTLEPDPWVPMTRRSECEALAGELRQARDVATRHPTVADAVAAGYWLGDRYHAGLGVHYQNQEYLEAFDPAHPMQLLYDGPDDDSRLVGLSYVVRSPGGVPPEGFTGDNDRWHRHRHYCLDPERENVNISSDVLSEEECRALGGLPVPNADGWMLHVWVAPGCESDWGMFSSANPRLPYLPEGEELGPGCGSGRTVVDPLDLDVRGNGPTVD